MLSTPSASLRLGTRHHKTVHIAESEEEAPPPKSLLKKTGVWRGKTQHVHHADPDSEEEEDNGGTTARDDDNDPRHHPTVTVNEDEAEESSSSFSSAPQQEQQQDDDENGDNRSHHGNSDEENYSYTDSEAYRSDKSIPEEDEEDEGLPLYEEDPEDRNSFLIIVKGAPEVIFPMCDTVCLHGRVFHLSHRGKRGKEEELRNHLTDFYSEIGSQFEVRMIFI